MRHVIIFGALTVAASAGACAGSSSDSTEQAGNDAGAGSIIPNAASSSAESTGGSNGVAGTGQATGLPCDVQALLENRCIACHSSANPDASPLLGYDDLLAPSRSDPAKTMAAVALERLKSAVSPMPPPPAEPPDATEIQTFEDWVSAGSPRGAACTDPPPNVPPSDAGLITPTCTSNVFFKDGGDESPRMHPGLACSACHQQEGGPNLTIAGTVYPTLHEPDNCNGSAPPPKLKIVITDARNKVIEVDANEVGNFFTRSKLRAPFRAKVTDGTKTREMVGSVTSGDCNSCHGVAGANGAPGRIMAP